MPPPGQGTNCILSRVSLQTNGKSGLLNVFCFFFTRKSNLDMLRGIHMEDYPTSLPLGPIPSNHPEETKTGVKFEKHLDTGYPNICFCYNCVISIEYNTVQHITLQYKVIQYNTIQYLTIIPQMHVGYELLDCG